MDTSSKTNLPDEKHVNYLGKTRRDARWRGSWIVDRRPVAATGFEAAPRDSRRLDVSQEDAVASTESCRVYIYERISGIRRTNEEVMISAARRWRPTNHPSFFILIAVIILHVAQRRCEI